MPVMWKELEMTKWQRDQMPRKMEGKGRRGRWPGVSRTRGTTTCSGTGSLSHPNMYICDLVE